MLGPQQTPPHLTLGLLWAGHCLGAGGVAVLWALAPPRGSALTSWSPVGTVTCLAPSRLCTATSRVQGPSRSSSHFLPALQLDGAANPVLHRKRDAQTHSPRGEELAWGPSLPVPRPVLCPQPAPPALALSQLSSMVWSLGGLRAVSTQLPQRCQPRSFRGIDQLPWGCRHICLGVHTPCRPWPPACHGPCPASPPTNPWLLP